MPTILESSRIIRTLFSRSTAGALCSAVFLLPLFVYAQTTAVLTGRVTDSTKAVLPGATIVLRATTTGVERTLATDAEGNFRIENLAPGSYRLIVRSRGLAEKSQEITIPSGQTLDLQITLNPPGVVETVDVVERANEVSTAAKTDTPLIETPQSVSVITRERLVAQSPLTIQDALRYTAGVNADPYGLDSRGDWAVIRGGEEAGQYLNGLRRLFGYNNNVRPDPFAIEQIEVLRGPASVLYGQGSFNGVVNLVSKKPQATQRREVSLQFGSFGRKQAAFDLTGAIDADDKWLYRVIALGRDSGTQVDYVPDDRLCRTPLQVQRICWEAIKQEYQEGEKQISRETILNVIMPDFRDLRTELRRKGYAARDLAYDYGYSTAQVNRFLDGKLPADDPAGKTLSVFLKTLGVGQ